MAEYLDIKQAFLPEQKSVKVVAYHGTRANIPFRHFDPRAIGTGIVSTFTKNYGGFFFTTEFDNAVYFTEWFVAKVEISDVYENDSGTNNPPVVMKHAVKENKCYIVRDVVDGQYVSDVIVVPANLSSSVKIVDWVFVGEEESLFESYDKFFGGDESDWQDEEDEDMNFVPTQDLIEDMLSMIDEDLSYLLTIPEFKKYYDSRR